MASRVNDHRGSLFGAPPPRREGAFERFANRAAAPVDGHAAVRERSWAPAGAVRHQVAAMRDWGGVGMQSRSNHPPTVNSFDSTIQAPSAPPMRSRP